MKYGFKWSMVCLTVVVYISWEYINGASNSGPHEETQPAIACSKLTRETLEQGVKYVQR